MDNEHAPLLVLSKTVLQTLVPFGAYVDAAAEAFRLHALGRALQPEPMHSPVADGGFHVKAGCLPLGSSYVAIKTNANFPDNRRRHGLPTIQGAILLFEAERGKPAGQFAA